MRPATLAEVARLAAQGEPFELGLANFLDDFYAMPDPSALSRRPELLAPQRGASGRVLDAYLAATAEHLACQNGWLIPQWVGGEEHLLRRPWFASSMAALRAVLIHESPPAFRTRNLFISANALERA